MRADRSQYILPAVFQSQLPVETFEFLSGVTANLSVLDHGNSSDPAVPSGGQTSQSFSPGRFQFISDPGDVIFDQTLFPGQQQHDRQSAMLEFHERFIREKEKRTSENDHGDFFGSEETLQLII